MKKTILIIASYNYAPIEVTINNTKTLVQTNVLHKLDKVEINFLHKLLRKPHEEDDKIQISQTEHCVPQKINNNNINALLSSNTLTIHYISNNNTTEKKCFECHRTDLILFLEDNGTIIPFTIKTLESNKTLFFKVQKKEENDTTNADNKLYELLTPITEQIHKIRIKKKLGLDEEINFDENNKADQIDIKLARNKNNRLIEMKNTLTNLIGQTLLHTAHISTRSLLRWTSLQ